jgi:O-antigen ligase
MLWQSRHRWRLLRLAAIGGVLLMTIPGMLARFTNPSVHDASGRTEIWRIGFDAFKHHWFAGSGYGSFLVSYQTSFLDVYQPSITAQDVQNSHNLIVQGGVELGIVGIVLLLAGWWLQYRTLAGIERRGGWGDVRVAMEATIVALFVSAMSLDLMTFKSTWLAFTAAWIVRSAYVTEASQRREGEP